MHLHKISGLHRNKFHDDSAGTVLGRHCCHDGMNVLLTTQFQCVTVWLTDLGVKLEALETGISLPPWCKDLSRENT